MNGNSSKLKDCSLCFYSLSCTSCYDCNYSYRCVSGFTSHSCNYCFGFRSCNYCNYCYYSKNLRMSEWMLFCLGDSDSAFKGEGYQKKFRIFNKDVSKEVFDQAIASRPRFSLPRASTYEEAWRQAWPEAGRKFKEWVRGLPNYDEALFQEITGVAL